MYLPIIVHLSVNATYIVRTIMKSLFSGFYGSTEEDIKRFWQSDKSIFVFDTNALLLLYRCERETREAFFSQWEKIRDRVFLPYHVCLEYQRNRLTAIKEHVMELNNAGQHIAGRIEVASDISKFEDKQAKTIRRYESLRGKVTELSALLQTTVDTFVKDQIDSRIKEADFLSSHDTVRDRISELATSRIGDAPNQQIISDLEKQGEERYKNQIPLGFEDAKTKGDQVFTYNGITYKRKFGDWFIWHEILSYTEVNKPVAVIFVSNDSKKDWLFETGGQIRGPLESLKTEISQKGEGTQFLFYSSASFLNAANSHLKGKITSPEVIKEVERASEDSNHINHIHIVDYDENEWLKKFFESGKSHFPNGVHINPNSQYVTHLKNTYDVLHPSKNKSLSRKISAVGNKLKEPDLSDEVRDILNKEYLNLLNNYIESFTHKDDESDS